MALPSSGNIELTDIQTETNTSSLNAAGVFAGLTGGGTAMTEFYGWKKLNYVGHVYANSNSSTPGTLTTGINIGSPTPGRIVIVVAMRGYGYTTSQRLASVKMNGSTMTTRAGHGTQTNYFTGLITSAVDSSSTTISLESISSTNITEYRGDTRYWIYTAHGYNNLFNTTVSGDLWRTSGATLPLTIGVVGTRGNNGSAIGFIWCDRSTSGASRVWTSSSHINSLTEDANNSAYSLMSLVRGNNPSSGNATLTFNSSDSSVGFPIILGTTFY